MTDTQKRFDELLEEIKVLRVAKNADYGNNFLTSYNNAKNGNGFLMLDILRKTTRIEVMLGMENKTPNETIYDSLKDLAVIALNAHIALEERKKNV